MKRHVAAILKTDEKHAHCTAITLAINRKPWNHEHLPQCIQCSMPLGSGFSTVNVQYTTYHSTYMDSRKYSYSELMIRHPRRLSFWSNYQLPLVRRSGNCGRTHCKWRRPSWPGICLPGYFLLGRRRSEWTHRPTLRCLAFSSSWSLKQQERVAIIRSLRLGSAFESNRDTKL